MVSWRTNFRLWNAPSGDRLLSTCEIKSGVNLVFIVSEIPLDGSLPASTSVRKAAKRAVIALSGALAAGAGAGELCAIAYCGAASVVRARAIAILWVMVYVSFLRVRRVFR